MWACNKCGTNNSDNSNYCCNCGQKRQVKNGNLAGESTKTTNTTRIIIVLAVILFVCVFAIYTLFLKPDPHHITPYSETTADSRPTPTYSPTPVPTPVSTPAPTTEPKYVWSEWSDWSTNVVTASSTREVETRQSSKVIGYNMVHYGTQQEAEPHFRMFRDYSISRNYEQYGARASYGEKHLTKYVTVPQMSNATTYQPDSKNTINLVYNGKSYGGYQMGTTTAFNFGDDNMVWFIESEEYSSEIEYRHRDLVEVK